MNTFIFDSYKDFLNREDKDANGVSSDFAEKHSNWEEMNQTNRGCWNCVDCMYCVDSNSCYDCHELTGCTECSGCTQCVDSYELINCSLCVKCDGWVDAVHYMYNEAYEN